MRGRGSLSADVVGNIPDARHLESKSGEVLEEAVCLNYNPGNSVYEGADVCGACCTLAPMALKSDELTEDVVDVHSCSYSSSTCSVKLNISNSDGTPVVSNNAARINHGLPVAEDPVSCKSDATVVVN